MKLNTKCARAVAAILGAHSAGAAYTAAAADQSEAAAGISAAGIQEVVVTAQRRAENVQNVPIAIQAFTGDTLEQLNVTTFDDFIKYLPNVTAPSAGPGQDQIFMRGLSVGSDGTQSGGSINGFPNVAIYLDDQSGQLPGRNLDIYAADLERIEVLEGPQGTLFGAGAQAGVIRYITNKPKINVTEGSVTAGYGDHRRWRPQYRHHGRAQPASDCGYPGGSRRDLQRQARRLHQQRAGHLHAQVDRSWHRLCAIIRPAAAHRRRAGDALPGSPGPPR